MKKIFALLFSLGALTSVFAQSGSYGRNNNSRDIVLGQSGSSSVYSSSRNDSYAFNTREAQIQKINREFDAKIAAVKRDRHMRTAEKNRQVRSLELQRNEQIRQVNARFSERNNHYDDHMIRNQKGRY